MKRFFYTACFIFFIVNSSFAQILFDNYFETGAIRYDYELVGDRDTVEVVAGQVKFLKEWGGNPNYLIEDLNFGTYRFQIHSVADGELIFQKGFSPLFWEWQTTAEATKKKRSFYQALHFPKPISDVSIQISVRDDSNHWKPIFSDTLKSGDYFIQRGVANNYLIDTILYHGNKEKNVDLVLLSEGYKLDELDKYIQDSKRLTDYLFESEPFKKMQGKFNVFAVKIPSIDSGADIPGSLIYKNTAFNSHYYTFDSPRYLTTSDMKSIYDALDGIGFDQIYLLVNTERYGGGGFYNFLNICSSDNVRSPFVFCHEFGHGFGGLGDEYYTSETTYEEFFDKTTEPWEPNLTTLVDFDSKWGHLIEKGMPIPTPRDSVHMGKVGVFEGGGYEANGIYSPVMSCWMKEMSAGAFCPVCQEAIERVINNQTK